MTITYQYGVSSGTLNGFAKLLFRWKGSVYKLIYKELICFVTAYVVVRVVYKSVLNEVQRSIFEQLALYCAEYIDLIPLSFVLGFYVTFVVQRWWTQFVNIPFPDKLLNTVIIYVEGTDEKGHLIRRNLMRYWNLLFVLMMMSISTAVKKRFPTLQHVVKAGYMTEEELDIYTSIDVSINTFWMPTNWFLNLLNKARLEGRIRSDIAIKHIVEELNEVRDKLKLLWCHDWVTLPLVYTQVVTWATHLFFVISLIGRQYLDPSKKYKGHEVDFYIPFFTLIQFLFYMGWLKVAEELINPFGSDDDDIEVNWLIDRHILVSYLGVEDVYKRCPTLLSPYQSDQGDSSEKKHTFTQLGQELTGRTITARKKWTSFLGKCCKNSKEAKMPRMVGKPDFLLCSKALAMLNQGTWKFSQDQMHQIPRSPTMSSLGGQCMANCVVQTDDRKSPFGTLQPNDKPLAPISISGALAVPTMLPLRRNTFHIQNNSSSNSGSTDILQNLRSNSLRINYQQYLNPAFFISDEQQATPISLHPPTETWPPTANTPSTEKSHSTM